MSTDKKTQTFESNMTRLEEIVRTMERGDISLEDSLKLFQEGTCLVERCGKLLDEAEMIVTKIVTDANGAPAEERFIDETEI